MSNTTEPTIKRVEQTRSAEMAIRRGKKLLSEKRFDEALNEFEQVLEQGQATAFVHSAIGRIKFKQKDLDGALHHFQEAIRLDPTHPQPYLRSARIYAARRDLQKAREQLENALRVNPRSPVAHAALGQILAREGKHEEALAEFTKALTFNPRIMMARRLLATTLMKMGRKAEAMNQIRAALRIKADDPQVHAILGRLHLEEKDYDGAQRAFSEALALNPEAPLTVRLGLVEAYLGAGNLGEAEKGLEAVPQREQFSPYLHKLWGDLYHARGMHKEALEEYRAASLTVGEDMGIEGLEDLDLMAEDLDDEMIQRMATEAATAAGKFVARKREEGQGKGGA